MSNSLDVCSISEVAGDIENCEEEPQKKWDDKDKRHNGGVTSIASQSFLDIFEHFATSLFALVNT